MFKNLIAKLKCRRGQAGTASKEAGESGAEDESSQAQGEEKLEGLIEDIDFKDIPEDKRAEVKKLVAQKVKNYDAGYRAKTESLTEKEKTLEEKSLSLRDLETLQTEIKGKPELEKAVTQMINDSRAGRPITDKKIEKTDKLIDQMLNKANGNTQEDASQREQLNQLRTIVHQESPKGISKEDFDALKESMQTEIDSLKRSTIVGLRGKIDSEYTKLEGKFGPELMGKFKNEFYSMAEKYPDYVTNDRASKILFHLAKDSELEDALFKSAEKRKEVERKNKEDGTFPGGESTPSKSEIPRDKAGRVDYDKYLQQRQSEGAFK